MKNKTTKIMMVWMLTLSLLAANLTSVFADSETPGPQPIGDKSPNHEMMTVPEPVNVPDIEVFQDNENTEKVDFSGSELPEDWKIGGNAKLTGNGDTDEVGDGWLRLTDTESYVTGYAIFDQTLNTANGLAFSFDYASWGGSGADGIVFFLIDGETSMDEFNLGGEGGSLGYSPRHKVGEGLSNAFVGIGLDEFGNFANNAEGRNGGINRTRDSVTVRGSGDGFDGYEFIANSGNLKEGIDTPNVKERPDQSGIRYRNVSLVFTPMESQYMLTMKIQFGAENEAKEIFNNLTLPGIVPSTVKYGFTGTSGGSTNYHEIRNIMIDKAVIENAKEDAEEELQEDSPKKGSTNSIRIPVFVAQVEDTLFVIPVTGSQVYDLSCTSASKLEIIDQGFAILPASCGYRGSLELAQLSNLEALLPDGTALIQALELAVRTENNEVLSTANKLGSTIGFYIDPEMTENDMAIYYWNATMNNGEGAWEKLDTNVDGNEITAAASNVGTYILVKG